MSNQQLPAFTPVPATPTQQLLGLDIQPAVKRKAAKKNGATVAKGKKKSRATAPVPTEKRQRRARVAPLQMDAAQALNALAGLSKKEVESLQALIDLLNPLPRPARQRVLTSVASILGK